MRNVETVTIKGTEYGRDDGKILRLTEMSASKKEAFSFKVVSSIDIKNPEVKKIADENSNTLALTEVLRNGIDYVKYTELCNDYLYCYECFDKLSGVYVQLTPENIDNYIEELKTRKFLREKSESFNNSFFQQGEDLKSKTEEAVK
jgi:hypothetical protein